MNNQLDIISVCLLCVMVSAGALFLMRMMGRGGLARGGMNRPMANDPDIESRGEFGDSSGTGYPRGRGGSIFPQLGGRNQSARDRNGYPGRRGGSLFPPLGGRRSTPQGRGTDRPRNDDPDISSRGGFGR